MQQNELIDRYPCNIVISEVCTGSGDVWTEVKPIKVLPTDATLAEMESMFSELCNIYIYVLITTSEGAITGNHYFIKKTMHKVFSSFFQE